MKETKLTTNPEQGNDTVRAAGSISEPNFVPPEIAGSDNSNGDCGCGGAKVAGEAFRTPITTSIKVDDSAPLLHLAQGESGGITAWLNSKQVIGLWSVNQDKNAWANVAGIGWKKLANNSHSAIMAFTMLTSHAFDRRRTVNYREESDGMIREIYVF